MRDYVMAGHDAALLIEDQYDDSIRRNGQQTGGRFMICNICSLYLCVKDMDRAVSFYETFFEQAAAERDPVYSVFDISGFRLGLFAYQKMNEPHTWGSNCLPSISLENVEMLRKKLENLEICFPLKQIKNNWVAEFVDSEGNHIEVTAPVT